jgi:hypothetical protein
MTPSEVPHTITVTATGTSTVLASTQVRLAADTRYTVVFAQNSTGDTLFVIQDTLVLEDTLLTPRPGYLLHRIVNALPNVGAMDVYVRSGATDLTNLTGLTPVISNLAFGASTPYLWPYPSSSGVYGIIVTVAEHPDTVLHVSSFSTDTGEEGEAMMCLLESTYPDNGKPTGLLCFGDEPRIVNRWP